VNCLESGRLLDAYVDNELWPAESADLQAHLETCVACSQRLADRESLGRLVRRMPYHAAPDRLRLSIATSRKRSRFTPKLLAIAAAVTLSVSVGGTETARLARAWTTAHATTSMAEAAVDSYVRAQTGGHLFEVRSSDRHTVKPWFLGKLDFSPPVEDLSSIGFPLVGGRLDHVAGKSVAALVYQRRLHPITVFISIATDQTARNDARSIRGFQVRHWIRHDMSFWAISDLNDAELDEFARALDRRP
jgi:anti-sigma factor RsiW